MIVHIRPVWIWITISSLLTACHLISPSGSDTDEMPIASVGDQHLYLSDLKNIVHPSTTPQDSISITTAYIDQWVRDQLLARQAAKFFKSDHEIDRLVENYRTKLLQHYLEEQIISARFDTTVSHQELSHYYQSIKQQFPLQEGIYQVQYAKIPRSATGISEVIDDWRQNRDSLVFTFAQAYGGETHLDTLVWHTRSTIDSWYDNWSSTRLGSGGRQHQRDQDYEYFLQVFRHLDKGQLAPLSYIKGQILRIILHNRRNEIVEEYKQELYEEALKNNTIKLP